VAEQALAPLVRVMLGILLLLLGYAFSIAAGTALADAYAAPAESYLQDKRDAREAFTEEEWQALSASLKRALALAPGDPRILSELARLHRVQLEVEDLDAGQITRHGDSATGYYQRALALRPTWPWDWGNLALVKYEQYQDSSEVYQDALVRAVQFGPRQSSLQRLVTELGIDSWPVLRPDAVTAVLKAADRALERNPASFSGMAVQLEKWRPLCRRAGAAFPHLARRCAAEAAAERADSQSGAGSVSDRGPIGPLPKGSRRGFVAAHAAFVSE